MILKFFRGVSTIEVMIMMLGMSIVILSASAAKIAAFKSYQELIHRERAELFAVETLEQFEALKRSKVQQNYMLSWENFLGNSHEGQYLLTSVNGIQDFRLLAVEKEYDVSNEESAVKIYESDQRHDFYTRLERSIMIQEIPSASGEPQKRLVTVSVYYGLPEAYFPESVQQVSLQRVFSESVGPGAAI